MLDFLDTKKKLPGERKPVFPDGVPGLEQGVPKELYKGSAQEQIDQQNAQAATRPPRRLPRSRNRSRPRNPGGASRRRPPDAAAAADAATEEDGGTAAAPPAPKPKKIVRKRTTAPPPDQQPRSRRRPAQPASATAAAIRRAFPGADAERHLYALDSVFDPSRRATIR